MRFPSTASSLSHRGQVMVVCVQSFKYRAVKRTGHRVGVFLLSPSLKPGAYKSLVWTRHQFRANMTQIIKTQTLGLFLRFRLGLGEKGESGLLLCFSLRDLEIMTILKMCQIPVYEHIIAGNKVW